MKNLARGFMAALLLLATPAFADDVSNGSYNTTDGSNTGAPPNGWPGGMPANQVEPSARAMMGATKRWWERANPTLSTTGSAGAYILTPTNTSYPTAYTQGEVTCAKANFTSVGNDTLNENSLGAKNIYLNNGSSLVQIAAGQIISGEQFCVSYDGALNSSAGGWQLLTAVYQSTAAFLQSSNNLSDVGSAATARTNLGLGSAARGSASNVADMEAGYPLVVSVGAGSGQFPEYDGGDGTIVPSGLGAGNFDAAGTASSAVAALPNGSRTSITVSASSPSGTPANGDIWIQY